MASSVLLAGANGSLAMPAIQHLLSTYPTISAILAVRNTSASDPNTRRLLEIIAPFKDRVSLRSLDLADLSSVHSFANSLAAEIASGAVPALASIICNAFYWNLASLPELTSDGFEKTFQINHLAHAALILRLLGSCTANARILVLASDAHYPGKNSLEKYPPALPEVNGQNDQGDFDILIYPETKTKNDPMGYGFQRYANSKLAIVAWMYALNRRLYIATTNVAGDNNHRQLKEGITAIAVNPGNLGDSRALRSNTPTSLRVMSRVIIKPLSPLLRIMVDPTMRTAKDAGVDVIELAVGKEYAHAEGYFTMRKKDESSVESKDEMKQEALWTKTLHKNMMMVSNQDERPSRCSDLPRYPLTWTACLQTEPTTPKSLVRLLARYQKPDWISFAIFRGGSGRIQAMIHPGFDAGLAIGCSQGTNFAALEESSGPETRVEYDFEGEGARGIGIIAVGRPWRYQVTQIDVRYNGAISLNGHLFDSDSFVKYLLRDKLYHDSFFLLQLGAPSYLAKRSKNMNSDNQPTTPPSQSHDSPPQISPHEHDVPPEGDYGWMCVASTFWINAHTWGINSVRISLHMTINLIIALASALIASSVAHFWLTKTSFSVFIAYYLSHDLFPGTSSLEYAFVGGLSMSCALLVAPLATAVMGRLGTRATLKLCVLVWEWDFFSLELVVSLLNGFDANAALQMALLRQGFMLERIGLRWTFRALGIICLTMIVTAANLLRDRLF
ncbi:short-chain dehydrogenase, putative [Talaromyces stipitatus ATCC 10500]|uniref:Short-chain dehydrogenase, putative n=1 Tax=Talaromyces stipitatus (strain ATCC 10500 / CBS 375.48 / QM 6759 / NRRL 1006) TaxID=441959 RepID=B8MFX5_TALSN|nr:short-chain dehydrogenase, putative [Talaromyces stipitatus ATCC 10500]EED15842.1 short-chain dehydrogenase, putative [Talaromyces stipitatus ATCC 10500]